MDEALLSGVCKAVSVVEIGRLILLAMLFPSALQKLR